MTSCVAYSGVNCGKGITARNNSRMLAVESAGNSDTPICLANSGLRGAGAPGKAREEGSGSPNYANFIGSKKKAVGTGVESALLYVDGMREKDTMETMTGK